ncbi:MAG TPA: DinB family protein [Dermatophilaceae bacterium]|nr:DinB family protein [Dermatophilaceae bacterium]
MPFHAPPATSESEILAGFLTQQQDAFRAGIFGLSDEAAGRSPLPSALSVGTLVKHAAAVQRSWLASAVAAPEAPVDARSQEQRTAGREDEFTWLPTDTVAAVLADFDEASAAVLAAVRTLDVSTPVPVPSAPWFPQDVAAWSVRWVWLHLIEELARHAGHADLIREAVDGGQMYELVAARDGLSATPWLTPWHPGTAE